MILRTLLSRMRIFRLTPWVYWRINYDFLPPSHTTWGLKKSYLGNVLKVSLQLDTRRSLFLSVLLSPLSYVTSRSTLYRRSPKSKDYWNFLISLSLENDRVDYSVLCFCKFYRYLDVRRPVSYRGNRSILMFTYKIKTQKFFYRRINYDFINSEKFRWILFSGSTGEDVSLSPNLVGRTV